MTNTAPRIALLYPGDRAMSERPDPAASRFAALFEAFAKAGMPAEPVIWHEDRADEVAARLRGVHAVLVWCNPIEGGHRRARLDAVLTEVAAGGSLVSAHPDAVLRLGTKDVLLATRALPFGSAVHRIDSLARLEAELPARLQAGPRVLKQHRGHSGQGVWRVEQDAEDDGLLRVRHAQRGSSEQRMSMAELADLLAPYFGTEAGGHMIDQPWQARLAEGMVRAYLVQDRVAGFGHQAVNALHPGEAQPGPRLYHGPGLAAFQDLRGHLEGGWVEQLCAATGLVHDHLPLLWDCDFLLGERATGAPERYVLCEINVSSVAPFPPSCTGPIVQALRRRLLQAG